MLQKLDEGLDRIEGWILVITGVAVCCIIFVNALMRYIFKLDFYGNEEITLFFAFWLYFIGSARAAKRKTHITADMISIFTKNEKIIDIFHMLREVISLGMAAIATYWSLSYVMWSGSLGAKSSVSKLPLLIAQIPIFISFLLWTIYEIRDVVNSIKELKHV